MHVEHNGHFERRVSDEFGQHHEMVIMHPYNVIGPGKGHETLTHGLMYKRGARVQRRWEGRGSAGM